MRSLCCGVLAALLVSGPVWAGHTDGAAVCDRLKVGEYTVVGGHSAVRRTERGCEWLNLEAAMDNLFRDGTSAPADKPTETKP